MRRKGVEALLRVRKMALQKPVTTIRPTHHPYPVTKLSYLGNVSNEKAREFYRQHNVTSISPAFEIFPPQNAPVMFAKHCLKYQFGYCPKQGNSGAMHEPWTLSTGNHRFELRFDCRECEMRVV